MAKQDGIFKFSEEFNALCVRGMDINYLPLVVSNSLKMFGGEVDTYGIVTSLFTEIGSFLDIKQHACRELYLSNEKNGFPHLLPNGKYKQSQIQRERVKYRI